MPVASIGRPGDGEQDPRPVRRRVAIDHVEHLDVERRDGRPLHDRVPGALHAGADVGQRHDRVAGGGGRGGKKAGRDRGGGKEAESHGGASLVPRTRRGNPRSQSGRKSDAKRSELSSTRRTLRRHGEVLRPSYALTHLRTALSDTPYLRPTALQLVAAISASSCSYGGRSRPSDRPVGARRCDPSVARTRRAVPCPLLRGEAAPQRTVQGAGSSPQCVSNVAAQFGQTIRRFSSGCHRHAVDVVEDQRQGRPRHVVLAAQLAPAA